MQFPRDYVGECVYVCIHAFMQKAFFKVWFLILIQKGYVCTFPLLVGINNLGMSIEPKIACTYIHTHTYTHNHPCKWILSFTSSLSV